MLYTTNKLKPSIILKMIDRDTIVPMSFSYHDFWSMIICKFVAFLLLWSETIHFTEHVNVVFMKRKYQDCNLKTKGWYFGWDGLSALISFCYVGMPMVAIPFSLFHFISHLFYVLTWNRGYYAIRIRKWTSIDQFTSSHFTPDYFLTWIDIITHTMMIYFLFLYISVNE